MDVEEQAGRGVQIRNFVSSNLTLGVGVAFIFVGFGLVLWFDPNTFMQKLFFGFLIEVGFALTIAWGVGNFIEANARREYNEYVQEKGQILSQNVFRYLYSVDFPRKAFKVIEDYILAQPVIKTRQQLDVELLTPEDDSGWVKMRCQFDYTLKNLSERSIEHPVRFHASKVSGLDAPAVAGIGLQSLIVGDLVVPPEEFASIDRAADDEVGQQKFETKAWIGPQQELRVRVTFVQLKRTSDNDLWQSNSVCNGLELRFRYDPSIFDVFIEPVHPSNRFHSDLGPNGGDNCRIVSIEEALLPKNGVFMWWNRRQHGESGAADE